MPCQAFSDLIAHCQQTEALAQAGALLSWEQEVMMPRRAAAQRAEQIAAVSAAVHARRTDPAIGDWLDRLNTGDLSAVEARNAHLIRRAYEREMQVPEKLRKELARRCSVTQGVWAEARAANRFGDLAPALSKVLELKREEAAWLQQDGMTLYDALLDEFEPGMTSSRLDPLFDRLRSALVALLGTLPENTACVPDGHYPIEAQRQINRAISKAFGYDVENGRLDEVTHPFCTGTMDDVRITTRYDESDPLSAILTTIHETGHAIYEQNREASWAFTPAASYSSMGIHESQSRLFENQVGRSRAFADYLLPKLSAAFPDMEIADADVLFRILNRVEPGFIRVEADELHYNLHIILRTGLERDMIEGRLEVADLEDAWNARFEADFGRPVDSAANGVLQDVHWPCGLWGYFPTYTLGNIYAAALFTRLSSESSDLDSDIREGRFSPVVDWMAEHIHRKGNLLAPDDLLIDALGFVPNEKPLVDYLRTKFLPMS